MNLRLKATNHVKGSRDMYVQGHWTGHCQRWGLLGRHYFKSFMSLPLHDYCSCAILVLQVTFIHPGLVLLQGTAMKMQSGQSGDLVTAQAMEEGGNWGSLNWLLELGLSLATLSATLGSAWCCSQGRDFHASLKTSSVMSKELSTHWLITFKKTNWSLVLSTRKDLSCK